jgi:HSP20 family protein
MALIRWDPLREMWSLRETMNRLFDESFIRSNAPRWQAEGRLLPVSADLVETDDSLIFKADLPGLKPEDVDISVSDSVLTVKGEYKTEKEEEEGDVHFKERRYGRFQRAIRLPDNVDTDAAEAKFEDGVLKISLPKTEEAKPKQIKVKA